MWKASGWILLISALALLGASGCNNDDDSGDGGSDDGVVSLYATSDAPAVASPGVADDGVYVTFNSLTIVDTGGTSYELISSSDEPVEVDIFDFGPSLVTASSVPAGDYNRVIFELGSTIRLATCASCDPIPTPAAWSGLKDITSSSGVLTVDESGEASLLIGLPTTGEACTTCSLMGVQDPYVAAVPLR